MSTWILLRGLAREKRHWGSFPAQLMEQLPGARIIALDLPGNGEFNALPSPTTITDMASACRQTLAQLGASPPYNLLAISMGAMVATAWAEAHPGEIGACVLINTSFGSFSPLHHRMRPRAWPILLKIMLNPTPEGRERLILKLTSSQPMALAHVIATWSAIRQACPVSPWNALRQLLAAARFHAPPSPSVPVLLLVGAADRLVNPCCSREIARRWNCAMAIHPGAGHDLPLDDGPWVAKEIRSWHAGSSFAECPETPTIRL